MVITMMVTTIMVALLGESRAVMAREVPVYNIREQDSGQGLSELLEAANTSENMELLGHLGGIAGAIEVRGQYAYAGFGQELAILDVSDPANIQRVGWMVAEGEVMDIAIQGDYGYLAYHGQDAAGSPIAPGMQVVNIRNPAMPVSLAVMEFDVCGFTENIEVQGNSAFFAYITCDAFGGIIMGRGAVIHRLDVTNHANPAIVDTYANGVPGSFGGLVVSPGWLYAVLGDANGSSMISFDISSPRSMTEAASIPLAPHYYYFGHHLALAGDYALTAASDQLQVIDVGDPTQPTAIITHTLDGAARGIFTDASIAYIPLYSATILTGTILVLDMTDPLNPIDLGAYAANGQSLDLSFEGATAYSANGAQGMEIFDTASLSQRGLIQYPENINDMVIGEGYAYSAADDGFWVLDVSDPNAPFPVAHLETEFPTVSLARQGNFAFLAIPGRGITVIDISNPLAPAEVAFSSLPADIYQLYLENNRLYVAAGYMEGLRIYDTSNPLELREIGAFEMPDNGINAVAVAGSHAYLAAWNDNLIVLDVSDPTAPEEIGTFDPPNDMNQHGIAVAVQGETVLLGTVLPHPTPLAGYDAGDVWIVDVSDPEEPVEVAKIPPGEYGWAPFEVGFEDGRAYVVYERQGLHIYDISNPNSVQVLGEYDPSEYTYGMTVEGDRIYLYNQSLYVLRYTDPALPSIRGRVRQTNHQPYPGAQISAGELLPVKTSDLSGAYIFAGVPEGTYNITPSLGGYVFLPATRTVSVPPDATGQDFTILPRPVQVDFTPGISASLRYTDTQGLPTWLDIPGEVADAPITVKAVPTTSIGAPGYFFGWHAFELNVLTGGEGAEGFVFDAPVVVHIQYSDQDVAVITDEGSLALWWWDGADWRDASQSCSPAGEYSRDMDSNMISLPICRTGVYKLMGPTRHTYMPVIVSQAR